MATKSGERLNFAQRAPIAKAGRGTADKTPRQADVPARPPAAGAGVEKTVLLGAATGLLAWLPLAAIDYLGLFANHPQVAEVVEPKLTQATGNGDDTQQSEVAEAQAKLPSSAKSDGPVDNLPGFAATFIQQPPVLLSPANDRSQLPASDSATAALASSPSQREVPRHNPPATKLEPPRLPPAVAKAHAAPRLAFADSTTGATKVGFIEAVAAGNSPSVAVAGYNDVADEEPEKHEATSDEATTIRLMHELNAADETTRSQAAARLQQRGFTAPHLEMARRLTSLNAAERAALARELPTATGIDSRLWLTWLLRDDDASVRMAALSVLATASDPATLYRIAAIARQDRDADIRRLGESLQKSLK